MGPGVVGNIPTYSDVTPMIQVGETTQLGFK